MVAFLQSSDSRANTGLSMDSSHEPSIPEEAAPPPPSPQPDDTQPDNIYKQPPQCLIYDSSHSLGGGGRTAKWAEEAKTGDNTPTTYDTPATARANHLTRLNSRIIGQDGHDASMAPASDAVGGLKDSKPVSLPASMETYDRVPPLSSRNSLIPAHAASPVSSSMPRGPIHVRKQSLPSDLRTPAGVDENGGGGGGSVYDEVPKPRTANNSPAVVRVTISDSASDIHNLYDRPPPPRGQLDHASPLTAKLSSPRPSVGSVSPSRPGAPPPSVDRNAKPPGEDAIGM